jgi:hypothetical protein
MIYISNDETKTNETCNNKFLFERKKKLKKNNIFKLKKSLKKYIYEKFNF